ncbi:hypothetical protein LGKMAHEF_04012 [Aeromonas salmonicida]|nr:Uncharacterised protein [Aeromonas salmonicida]SUU73315.1 Uncharacterised protein [Aeromonas salmonicida]
MPGAVTGQFGGEVGVTVLHGVSFVVILAGL